MNIKGTTCPIARVSGIVGDPFNLLIVRDLLSGAKRFGDLQVSLSGISPRTLTNKLKMLESCGIVVRRKFKERPPRVEYSLTRKGKDLGPVADAIRRYGRKHSLVSAA